VTDRYTLLCRAAMIAYERAFEYSKRGRLDEVAEELLYLREWASDLFDDFFFGAGRKAKREYEWVRNRLVELMEELLGLIGKDLPKWERELLEYWLREVKRGEGSG
jgi:hypothetical protein